MRRVHHNSRLRPTYNSKVVRRLFALFLLIMPGILCRAQDTQYRPQAQQIPAPVCTEACPPGTHEKWLQDIKHWRAERLIRIGFDGRRYSDPALAWTQSSFIQPQMMVEDRYFYDPASGK